MLVASAGDATSTRRWRPLSGERGRRRRADGAEGPALRRDRAQLVCLGNRPGAAVPLARTGLLAVATVQPLVHLPTGMGGGCEWVKDLRW